MALDLGKLLSENVPRMGPQREQSVYIDIDKLVSDERNFYELSDIDGLVRNIELIGLQQPIRVREVDGMYRIVSGHRRRAALQKLVDEGKEQFREVHCIVETVECSEAMQELRLIYANSDTRRMSPAEIDRQAQRIEAILLRMKEEGYQFEGRMRDHVAEICKVSKSKLSRLKVIREKLHPMLMADWEEGRLSEAVAYRIAQEPERIQNQLFSDNGHAPRTWTLEHAERAIDRVKNQPVSKTIDVKKLDARAAADDYLEQRAAEDVDFVNFIQRHGFEYFLKHAAGITRQMGIKEMKDRIGLVHVSHRAGLDDRWEAMPNGLTIKRIGDSFRKSWTEVWDAMAVEALRRCRLHQIEAETKRPEPVGQLVFNGWMPGGTNPAQPCEAVIVLDFKDGAPYKSLAYWNGMQWKFKKNGMDVGMEPKKWMALPEEEDEC